MEPTIRAIYRVREIPGAQSPYDRVNLKIYYPALYGDTPEERNTGVVPADTERGPYPVVILLPGINLGPESSSWLAIRLAKAGYITVAASAISEEMPGYISISPGLLMDEFRPANFGRGPNSSLLAPILDELAALQSSSVLAGLIDLNQIILGGHSAGGTAALLNANPAWFPGVCAAFSYGAHTGASVALGWPEETILSLPAALPALLLGGDRDGVIAASSHRYGREEGDPMHTLLRTFDEAVPDCGGNSYLFILQGANHFTFACPNDGCTGREFLDWETGTAPDTLREHLSNLILDFLENTLSSNDEASHRLKLAADHSWVTIARQK